MTVTVSVLAESMLQSVTEREWGRSRAYELSERCWVARKAAMVKLTGIPGKDKELDCPM